MDSLPQSSVCTRCNIEKPTSEFSRNKNRFNGVNYWCKDCVREYYGHKKAPNYPHLNVSVPDGYKCCSKCFSVLPKDKEHFRWSEQGGITQPCRQCARLHAQEFHKAHPEKARSRNARRDPIMLRNKQAEYRENNRDKTRAACLKYQKNNLDVYRLSQQRRRALKRSLPFAFSLSDWNNCLNYWGYSCAYCGMRDCELTTEHIIPLSCSYCPGTIIKNIVPACKFCNFSKHNKPLLSWLVKKFGADYAAETILRISHYFQSIEFR